MNSLDIIIPQDQLVNVCKYRQGSECCKYIVFLQQESDFVCGKKTEDLRNTIESQTDMTAQGDNCEGLPHEKK